jgi:cytochrome c oxidase subunit II
MNAGRLLGWMAAAAAMAFAAPLLAADPQPWQLNMTAGVTESSAEVYGLHMLILWICVVIGLIVFGAMAFAMWKFRKSQGAVAATWSHHTGAEIVWTVIPILILVAMAWPATRTLFDMDDTTGSEMTVKITGYQWMWRYEILNYRDQPSSVNFISRIDPESDRMRQLGAGLSREEITAAHPYYLLDVDRELVLPTDTKIRFVITADDVIHAWWVPALGWKQDAIPGIVNEAWTNILVPGTYRGQCAELCGKDHGFMPIVVRAVPRAEFESWLAAQESARDEAARTAQESTPNDAARSAAELIAPAKG